MQYKNISLIASMAAMATAAYAPPPPPEYSAPAPTYAPAPPTYTSSWVAPAPTAVTCPAVTCPAPVTYTSISYVTVTLPATVSLSSETSAPLYTPTSVWTSASETTVVPTGYPIPVGTGSYVSSPIYPTGAPNPAPYPIASGTASVYAPSGTGVSPFVPSAYNPANAAPGLAGNVLGALIAGAVAAFALL